jgi:palmitoyltransferase
MMDKAERNRIATNLWTARVVPVVLAGIVGYATYVLVALLCGTAERSRISGSQANYGTLVNYLLVKHHNLSAAIPILVIYFLLFMFMALSFIRLVYITTFEPPYVPLGQSAPRERVAGMKKIGTRKGAVGPGENGIAMGEYNIGNSSDGISAPISGHKDDPDSPGLEFFYTKEVFVSEIDGKPKWCSHCANWYVCQENSFVWSTSLEILFEASKFAPGLYTAEREADRVDCIGSQTARTTAALLDAVSSKWITSAPGKSINTTLLSPI